MYNFIIIFISFYYIFLFFLLFIVVLLIKLNKIKHLNKNLDNFQIIIVNITFLIYNYFMNNFKRGFEPYKNMWSLPGCKYQEALSCDDNALYVLDKELELKNIYLNQLKT